MSSFHLLSIFILTLGAYFFNYVSALNVESLVGGYTASEGTFKHQAAIIARENFSVDIELICNGAIIGPTIVLTAAQCFLGQLGTLKELSFSIIVNSTDLTTSAGAVVDIIYIYVPESTEFTPFPFLFNDIAIAQTALNMLVLHGCHLKSLKIPMYGESFAWASAVVAGYGDNEITLEAQANSNVRILVNGKTNYTLNHAKVIILGDSECYNNFVRISLPVDKLMCGVMITDRPGQHWGLCSNDFGAPLVYNNTVIGIASEHTPDCNDTGKGSLYTKVSVFVFFIRKVIAHIYTDSNLDNVVVHKNPIHVNYQTFFE